MNRQYSFALRLLAALFLLYLLFFQLPAWLNNDKCWNAVPNNSAFILKLNKPMELATSLGELAKLYPFQQFEKDIRYFDSLDIAKGSVLAVLQGNTPETFNWLFITQEKRDIKETLISKMDRNYKVSVLHDTPVYEFENGFSLAQYDDVILYAPYPLQVEQAIEQLVKRKSLWKHKNLRKLSRLEASGGVQCYFSLANLPSFLAPFIRSEHRDKLQQLDGLRDWLRLDIHRDSSAMQLIGQWKTELRTTQKTLTKAKTESNILNVLPDHTAFYFWGNLKEVLQTNHLALPSLEEIWQHTTGEAATVFLEAHNKQPIDNKLLFLRLASEAATTASLQEIARSEGVVSSNYQMFPLYKLSNTGFSHLAQIQDYLVFSKDVSLLETYLDKYITGQVLAKDVDFLRMLDTANVQKTASFYVHTQNLLPFLKFLFRESYFETIQKDFQQLQNTKGLHLDFQEDGQLAGRMTQPELLDNVRILWKTSLQKEAVIAPQLVYWNTKKHILIQDANHLLYCLDESGQMLWTKQLKGRILSDFQPIRFFDDERQQYFFNTAQAIHLINAAGEAVGAYPMNLQSPATNGMSVVDFDKTGFHHFFVACKNGNIYGFNQKGRPMEHWSPKYIGVVQHPVQHFQWQRKDFISILSQSGKIHILGRDASPRFPAYTLKYPSQSLLSHQATGKFPRIIVADTTATVHVIHPRGEHFTLPLKSGKNKNVKYAFADIWGDDRKDYVALSGQKLGIFAYDAKGFKKQFGGKFEYAQDTVFAVATANKDRVGLLYEKGEQIILFNEKQRPERGFPLAGTTPFILDDLFNNGEQILIVGNRNSVYAYRIGS